MLFHNRYTLNFALNSDALYLFRRTEEINFNNLDTCNVTNGILMELDEVTETSLIFYYGGDIPDSNLDTIILVNGGIRVGYAYITPINPHIIQNLYLRIDFTITEVEVDFNISYAVDDIGIDRFKTDLPSSLPKIYSNRMLDSMDTDLKGDYDQEGPRINGSKNYKFRYLDLFEEISENIHDNTLDNVNIIGVKYHSDTKFDVYYLCNSDGLTKVYKNTELIGYYNSTTYNDNLTRRTYPMTGYSLYYDNEEILILVNHTHYKIYNKNSGLSNTLPLSDFFIALPNYKPALVRISDGAVYDDDFVKMATTFNSNYFSSNGVMINYFGNSILYGMNPEVKFNGDQIIYLFKSLFLLKNNVRYNLNAKPLDLVVNKTTLFNCMVEFVSEEFIVFKRLYPNGTETLNSAEFRDGMKMKGYVSDIYRKSIVESGFKLLPLRSMLLKYSGYIFKYY